MWISAYFLQMQGSFYAYPVRNGLTMNLNRVGGIDNKEEIIIILNKHWLICVTLVKAYFSGLTVDLDFVTILYTDVGFPCNTINLTSA